VDVIVAERYLVQWPFRDVDAGTTARTNRVNSNSHLPDSYFARIAVDDCTTIGV
jgi:hypothetical protein